jgi:hypothetical protein
LEDRRQSAKFERSFFSDKQLTNFNFYISTVGFYCLILINLEMGVQVGSAIPPKKIYKKESVLQDPAQFSTACSALLAFHQSAIRDGQGEHLVFLGEGTSGEVRTREY